MFSVINDKDGKVVQRTFEQLSRQHKNMDENFYTNAFTEHILYDGDSKTYMYKED